MIDDAEFLREWNKSHAGVFRVARWLRGKWGLNLRIGVPELRPDAKSRHSFADDGDIEIIKRIEVKHRSIDFTSADDYPFPTVFVAERYTIDRMNMRSVEAFVILNKAGTHAAIISPRTRREWVTEIRKDGRDKLEREFLCCPVSLVEFREVA